MSTCRKSESVLKIRPRSSPWRRCSRLRTLTVGYHIQNFKVVNDCQVPGIGGVKKHRKTTRDQRQGGGKSLASATYEFLKSRGTLLAAQLMNLLIRLGEYKFDSNFRETIRSE
ncbi:hypothetical protein HAX54_048421 [Datura stramonium]|uniref:Uncharacterized protein n=1 Tax=Datura stramonium TaxID=4076 RepID=A0ABS8WJD3_DATST|nr:hypothetical protein [Datura stramonium]